jgi:plastocyanin
MSRQHSRRGDVRARIALRAIAVSLLAGLAACGGDSPSSPSPDTPTVTISATGVSPTEVRIAKGGRVNFMNNDVRPHAMSSDPITTHTDCPAINDVGTLTPGQSRTTGTLDVARTCGFHDHTNELDTSFKGTIIIQ